MMNKYLSNNRFQVPYLAIIVFFIFISCSNEDNSNIEIDIENNIDNFQNIKLSEFSNNIEYIALESNDSSLIETIIHIDVSEKYIFLYDTQRCLLFDRTGKFLREISHKGNGPNEYRLAGQVKILNDEIYIPNVTKKSLMVFDVENNLTNEIRPINCFTNKKSTENYLILNDSIFFVQIPNRTGKEKNRFACINQQGKVLKEYPNTTFFERLKPRVSSKDKSADFYRHQGKIRYKEVLNDTVWQIEEEKLTPAYVLKRGKFGTPNFFRGLSIDEFSKAIKECIWIHKIFEFENYLLVRTSLRKHYPFDFRKDTGLNDFGIQYDIIGVFNKETEEFFFVDETFSEAQPEPTGIENDIDGGINFMPNYLIRDSFLLGWVNAFELKQFISSSTFNSSTPKYPGKKIKLKQLAKNLEENDNPVLMLVKLKE